MRSLITSLFFVLSTLLFSGCSDNAIKDVFYTINNSNWSYDKPIKESFNIDDIAKPYNILINFRHTADYKYANLWVRVTLIDPTKKKTVERKEFQLAYQDGEWLGKGSGNLYSYQLIFKENFKFNTAGKYQVIIEQNMRDNPLREVTDVGLRVEPSL